MINLTRMNFGSIVTGLAECLCETLLSAGIPVCSCCATIGLPDGNCQCGCPDGSGSLRIWPGPIGPSRAFPLLATADDRFDHACGPPWIVATLNVEIKRCVPTMDESGTLSECDAASRAATLDWYTDVTAVRQALGCCLAGLKASNTIARWSLGATQPSEPQGGCAGSLTVATVGLAHCACP